ncbi:MAG: hypothetical protein M3347_05515 [Armatimonadota bacterium]|nr:hypothetical protein [Armatimonadota bacterium]
MREYIRANWLPQQEDFLSRQRENIHIWKYVSDLLVSLPPEQAKDMLLMLWQCDPPLISAVKAERLCRAAVHGAERPPQPRCSRVPRTAAWEWMHGVLQGSISAEDIAREHVTFLS